MVKPKQRNLFVSFGGVALADILANGVVVLLVVIILTLSIHRDQTEKETEQTAEISAILARDIASSIVFNDLPSSPPAVLHNYECVSPGGPWRNEYERHDCMPWLYPIIEFHEGYLREFNSNRRFSKELLLEENNEFDNYLRLLPPDIRSRIRVDIYDLDIYYLGLSIMSENNARPSHWHFLGEGATPPPSLDIQQNYSFSEVETTNLTSELGDLGGEDEDSTETGAAAADLALEQQLPADVYLRDAARLDELLPPELELARGSDAQAEREALEAEIDAQFSGRGQGELSYEEALGGLLADALLDERFGGGDEFGQPSNVQIRFPGAGQGTQETATEAQSTQLEQIFGALQGQQGGEPIEYHVFMIIFIMEYLKASEEAGFDRVSLDSIVNKMVSGEIGVLNHPLRPFAEDLREQMKLAFEQEAAPLTVNAVPCELCLSRLWLEVNQPISGVLLQAVTPQNFVRAANTINLRLRLFPYPDEGDETEFVRGDTILMYPMATANATDSWFAAAITDPNFSDLVIGYVHGEMRDGTFYVEGDVNSVRIDSQQVLSVLPNFPLRREIILGSIYSVLSFFILSVFFYLIGVLRRKHSG